MNNQFNPSKYQEAIFEHVLKSPNNLCVEGVAGCGKTVTIVETIKLLPKNEKILVLSFNKTIVNELKRKLLDFPCEVRTAHSFGFALVRNGGYVKATKPNEKNTKLKKVFNDIINNDEQFDEFFKIYKKKNVEYLISEIIPFFKSYLYNVSEVSLQSIIDKHDVDVNIRKKHMETFIELIKDILDQSKNINNHIDMDDMIWLPVIKKLSPRPKYQYVLIDEAQDLNRCQLELIKLAGDENSKFIFVGDRNQSIYGFRSADSESIPHIIKKFKCDTLPLDITYRCPRTHVELAQELVPNIECSSDAKEGIIKDIDMEELVEIINENNLILCRNNAPLIKLCEILYKNNIPFSYKNKEARSKHNDFINNLIDIIKKVEYSNIYEFKRNIRDWKEKKLKRTKKSGIKMSIQDTYDSLITICENLDDNDTIEDLVNEVKSKLEYEKPVDGSVEISTIHGAKGIENENVFILYPDLIPNPYAKKTWELIQEKNLRYVSITRSKNNMYFIRGDNNDN